MRTMGIKEILNLSLIVVFIFGLKTIESQSQDTTKYSEEITIIGSYKPTISDAYKITFSPSIDESGFTLPDVSYGINSTRMNTSIVLVDLPPARVVGEPLSKLYHSYIKLGYGNYSTPYFKLFVNSLRNDESQFSFNVNHISSSGKIKDYANSAYSKTNAKIAAKRFFKHSNLSGNVFYDRHMVHYYGFMPGDYEDTITLPSDDDIKQRYQLFGGQAYFSSNNLKEEDFGYKVGIDGYHFQDMYESTESKISVLASFNKGFEIFNRNISIAEIKANLDYYNTNDSLNNSANNGVARLNPSINLNFGQYELKLGFTVAAGLDTNSNVDLFPDVEARIKILPQYLTAYAGFTGNIKKSGYRKLAQMNPYIKSIVPFAYTKNKLEFYGGIAGNIEGGFDYAIRISGASVENMPFFVTDSVNDFNNMFTVIYDDATTTAAKIELGYHYAEKFRLTVSAEISNVKPDSLQEAWYNPSYIFSAEANYIIAERLILKGVLTSYGKQYAKVYENKDWTKQEIDAWLDLSLGAEFRYNKNLSIFADFNNVMSDAYQRWYNYPVQKLNFIGGVTYSF